MHFIAGLIADARYIGSKERSVVSKLWVTDAQRNFGLILVIIASPNKNKLYLYSCIGFSCRWPDIDPIRI